MCVCVGWGWGQWSTQYLERRLFSRSKNLQRDTNLTFTGIIVIHWIFGIEYRFNGEGNGTPLQYSCLENPMDRGRWWAAVRRIHKSRTRLSDFTFTFHFSLFCTGERNGNPLQCSCLENPRDRGAWWAAVYGVAQNRTRLKRLSSSSSSR